MVVNGFVTTPDYTICGAASDSLVMVLMISGLITVMVLVMSIVFGANDDTGEEGLLRRKPLLVPSFTFVITALLVIALVPIPMAQYHGLNEVQIHYYQSDTPNFRVYDGIAYRSTVDIHAIVYNLASDRSLIVQVDFKQNSTVIKSVNLVFNGTGSDTHVTVEMSVQLQPGLYEVDISYNEFDNGTPTGVSVYITGILSQPLRSGFFNEVMTWETYTFLLTAGSFFFILAGFCVGREDKKRIRQEPYDQEPPREGEVYIRRA